MTTPSEKRSDSLRFFEPAKIRELANGYLERAIAGELRHVSVNLENLPKALIRVLETTKSIYPDFQIPPYGVWRDFEVGGVDRWGAIANARAFESAEEMLTASADLAILTALMNTTRPINWSYTEPNTGAEAEGKSASALAAFNMFSAGFFSADLSDPFRVDAETLIRIPAEELATGLQWDQLRNDDLVQKMQRLLKRFGEALALRSDLFGEGQTTRPGLLARHLAETGNGTVDANAVLDQLLEALVPVWDGGAVLEEITLGDSFTHSAAANALEIMPFHLCAQEMVYSLVEPFAWAGCEVANLDALSGPSDLIHAVLFAETNVLGFGTDFEIADAAITQDRMVEIRAVTIALTDRLSDMLRKELNVASDQLPMTCILEGGTSRAGGQILRENGAQVQNLGKFMNPGSVFWLPFGA
ncbi:MAG: DUF1688 family protein [Roseibium sp.]